MSDDKKHPASSDTEYQYAEEEIGQELPEPEKKPPLTFRVIKDKLIARLPKKKKSRAILIFLVAIYIVYKFLSSGESTSPSPPPTPQKAASQPLSKPVAEVKSVKTATVEKTAKLSSLAETKKDFNGSSMAEQKSQMTELQTSLDQINHSITTLESALLSLTGSVIGLSNKMSALETMRREGQMSLRRHPLSIYHLQSLVPERAWLLSSRGNLITVKVGDLLPGYGKVEKINAQTGIIATSSGRAIHYGPNDS